MGNITVRYKLKDGKRKSITYSSDVRRVLLRRKSIFAIDLSELESCSNLEFLDLEDNLDLERIDLSPLASCSSLQYIHLGGTKLEKLDLEPLSSCTKLKELWISRNELRDLDISPLSACTQLERLDVRYNHLREVDLHALESCSELKGLYIGGNFLLLGTSSLPWLAYWPELEHLDLDSVQLDEVNTALLGSCPKLQRLRLGHNRLEEIDLEPLANCHELRLLELQNNELEKLDLSALASCPHLRKLNLRRNKLLELDIGPLASCRELQELMLEHNELEGLDLTPLVSCSQLGKLWINWNHMKEIDFTPLVCNKGLDAFVVYGPQQRMIGMTMLSEKSIRDQPHWTQLTPANYDIPVPVYDLQLIRHLARIVQKNEPRSWKHIHLARSAAEIIGPKSIGFVDINSPQFVEIVEETAPDKIRDRLIEAFCDQVDRRYTTIGADTNVMVNSSSAELVRRVPKVLELRNKEMSFVADRIVKNDGRVDLRNLWTTAYGFDILSALGLGLDCSLSHFEQVSKAFADIGFELSLAEEEHDPLEDIKTTARVRNYVFALVEYHNRK